MIDCAGGFGSYLLSMDERTYNLIGADYPGNRAEDVKNPGLLWMIGFIFVVSFLGLFSLVPLRKVTFVEFVVLGLGGVHGLVIVQQLLMILVLSVVLWMDKKYKVNV